MGARQGCVMSPWVFKVGVFFMGNEMESIRISSEFRKGERAREGDD